MMKSFGDTHTYYIHHNYTHEYINTHTSRHTDMITCTHEHIHTCTYILYTYIQIYTRTYIHSTYVHTYLKKRTYIHAEMHAYPVEYASTRIADMVNWFKDISIAPAESPRKRCLAA